MTAMSPVRTTPSLVNSMPPTAARSRAMTSTTVEPPSYDAHTQFPITPSMPLYSPGGGFEDPSRDPDIWSLATPTPATDLRASSIHENTASGAPGTPPVIQKPPNPRKEVARFVFAYFTTYILPILVIAPTLVVFYIWAWHIVIHPIPGSDFYQKYAWYHTYSPSRPTLTSGGAWSIAAVLYSIVGAVLHVGFFEVWCDRISEGILPLCQGGTRSWPCDCALMLRIMVFIMFILMIPLLGLTGLASVYVLLTVPAHGKPQGGGY